MSVFKDKHGHTLTCDICGITSPTRHTLAKTCETAIERGWGVGAVDRCPVDHAEAQREARQRVKETIDRMVANGTFRRVKEMYS